MKSGRRKSRSGHQVRLLLLGLSAAAPLVPTDMHMCMCVYTYAYMYTCMCTHMHICTHVCVYICIKCCAVLCLAAQLYLILCDPKDYSLQAPLSMQIPQARKMEWVAMPFSRGSSQPRDRTQVSCIAGKLFTV